MIIRSDFAITRLIILPYGALLVLYLAVVGGGGAWLYHQVRTVETRLLIDEVTGALEPLAMRLGTVDAASVMQQRESWLIEDLRTLFAAIPSLRNVSVRDAEAGFQMVVDDSGAVSSRHIRPLPAGSSRAETEMPAAQRLHDESDTMFLIRFDLTREPVPLARLDFGFDREMLLARVNEGVAVIEHSIIIFVAFYTTREEGNGLGLAIVYRVIAAHQGRVIAENRPQGARVVLILPLHPKETPAWWNKKRKLFPA